MPKSNFKLIKVNQSTETIKNININNFITPSVSKIENII